MTIYEGAQCARIRFPLGGIGTEVRHLGGWGQLQGFERTFLALAIGGRAWLLQGPPVLSDLAGDGSGEDLRDRLLGLPRFAASTFEGRFPAARLQLRDPDIPVAVTIDVWSPFVPGNVPASTQPAAVFEIRLDGPVEDAVLYVAADEGVTVAIQGGQPPSCAWPSDRPLFSDLAEVWRAVQAGGAVPGAWRTPLHGGRAATVVLTWGSADPLPHREETLALADRLAAAPVPEEARDAASSNLAVLRSPTVTTALPFEAWEGSLPDRGCCEGTCLHVWAYAAPALGDLFPALERSAIDQALDRMQDDGAISFRSAGEAPAADGQMALVARAFRHWQTSGDDAWLRDRWPRIERALTYAWVGWDADRDGVMEGLQHVTYDVDLHGPNPLTAGWYLTALRAAGAMAEGVGVPSDYDGLAARGAAWVDTHLWNGRFYVQQIRRFDMPPPNPAAQFPIGPADEPPRYQLGSGCLSDQLVGAWFGRLSGLGDVLDGGHVRTALRSIVELNWRADLRDHHHTQRIFATAGEAGLVNASWPDGGRPEFPIAFCDEVWTGVEYQLASHLRMVGDADLAWRIVRGARARYDGSRRNPFSEIECGASYARSMAAWALLPEADRGP